MSTGAAPRPRTPTQRRTEERRAAGTTKVKRTPTVRPPVRTLGPPPGILDAGLESMYEIFGTMLTSSADYLASLVERRAGAVDVARDLTTWIRLVTERHPPTWAHPNLVVRTYPAHAPIARLRHVDPDNAPHDTVPTLVLPPQAGHDSCIVDYAPGQSQVLTAIEAGCAPVYSMDWIGATRETRDATVEDYVDAVHDAVQHIGGHVNLVGDCQGGWLATIYAALHPESVHTLSIAGAPIDFHAGEPLIQDWLRVLAPLGSLNVYRALIAVNGGVLPGDLMLTGFKIMQPEAEIDRQLALLAHVHDERHVERYRRFENWFQWTQPIAGAFYLWIVEHLFLRNELLHDRLYVGGRHVDLHEIHCPLYLLAGTHDHITPPAQVFALADFAATPEEEVRRLITDGGHLGIFMGHQSLRTCWRPLFEDIAARSRHRVHPDGAG
ncbi:MAG TPA: alpha/beta fold hydrolase [Kineosporiaceae bacterium]